jgi:hypothetical protein
LFENDTHCFINGLNYHEVEAELSTTAIDESADEMSEVTKA